jgi:hypothetical protein
MTHAAVVSAGLSWFLVFLALLLVMFVYTVIRIPPQATGAHAHTACATGALRPRDGRGLPRSELAPRASPATPVIRPGVPLTQRPGKL